MEAIGIARRVDDLGRINIPKEIRRDLQIREGDPLEIYVDGRTICLKKYQSEEYKVAALRKTFRLISKLNDCDVHFIGREGAVVATSCLVDKPRGLEQSLYDECCQNLRANGKALKTPSGKECKIIGYCLVGSQWFDDGGIFITGNIDEERAGEIAGAVASWMYTILYS